MASGKQSGAKVVQRDYINVLQNLVQGTAKEHRQSVLLETALDCILDGTSGHGACVFLSGELDQALTMSASRGITGSLDGDISSVFGPDLNYAIEVTAQTAKPSQIGNQAEFAFPMQFEGFGYLVCTPLKVENRNLGVLAVFFPSDAPPQDQDLSFLDLAGDFLAMKLDFAYTAVVQLAIEEELLRNERYLECLSGISSSLLSAPDPMSALPGILGWLRQETGACRCSFYEITFDDKGECLSSIQQESLGVGIIPQVNNPAYQNIKMLEGGLRRWVELFQSGNELVGRFASMPESKLPIFASSGTVWLLILPVTALGAWVGNLSFSVTKEGTELGDQEVALLRSAANALSAALERLAVIKELEDAHNHLENILQATTSHAIIATDHDFRVIHVSRLAEDLFGYSKQEIIGKSLTQTNIFEGTELEGLTQVADSVHGGENWEGDIVIVDPGGQDLTLNTLISGMYTKGGVHYGYTFFVRDVTEQRLQERQLVERQRMESVGMLAGGIAHDFNNILMGILGYASLAKDRIDGGHPAHRMVGIIEKSAERAASLTRELLAYARGGKSQSVNVQLNDQIDEILSILTTNIPKGVLVKRSFSEKLPWILVDPAQLQQVIMNLCLNAGDAVSERLTHDEGDGGEGIIQISTCVEEMSLENAEKHGIENHTAGTRFVRMEVTDNGTGMDEETMRRIFEPFFTTKITGRGLGLAAVEGIIRNHGGCLLVESKLGQGSTFTVMLPEDLDCVIEDIGLEVTQLGGSETILVIDDEETNRQLALLTLTNIGHQVLLAENPRQGLDVLKKHGSGINLILLDLTMPGMSTEKMLAEIEQLETSIPIILTSGFDEAKLREFKGTHNAAAFLQKPYTPEVLARAVRKVLDSEK